MRYFWQAGCCVSCEGFFMRQAHSAHMWKKKKKSSSFWPVREVLFCVGHLQIVQNPLGVLHPGLGAEAVCDCRSPTKSPHWWLCFVPTVQDLLLVPVALPSSSSPVGILLPSQRLDVCAGLFAILNQKCTVCASDETAWKESPLLPETVLSHPEHSGNWAPPKSWHMDVALNGRSLC